MVFYGSLIPKLTANDEPLSDLSVFRIDPPIRRCRFSGEASTLGESPWGE